MSNSENICVGCKHPIVDETIEGDVALPLGSVEIDFSDLAKGVDSKCRNCAVILDAIVTFVGREDRSFLRIEISVYFSQRRQELVIHIGIGEDIEVIRYSDLPRGLEPLNSDVWNIRESRPFSEDTSSQETVLMIQDWKTNCMQHHKKCTQLVAASVPKRILEITTEHIFLREHPGCVAPYACLSHCWGSNGPAVKLTAETVGSLRGGLKTSSLPKTFRDAVEMCCHLGIHYVWIDALCILQDSEEDWEEAAATMGDIYENSQITLAATASQDSNGGLFFSDRPVARRLEKHPHLFVRKCLNQFPTGMLNTAPTSMPLLTRAWVYQERRLSHRTIHFGKHQVYWECQTGFASEDSREDKIWNKYATDFELPNDLDWGDSCGDHKTYWHKTVSEYTDLQMTYESDRLPAIAAVVDRMSRLQRVDDVYVAGLWKDTILSDLLWRSDGNNPRPARVAPSWSWVSAQNSMISWDGYQFTKEAKVVDLEYTVVGAANLGEVTNASIILLAPVLNLTGFDELGSVDDGYGVHWANRFTGILRSAPITEQFRQNNLEINHIRFSPDYDLTTANPPFRCGCTIQLLVARDPYAVIGGIVIQQVSKNPSEYRRIGFLHLYLGTTKSEMDGNRNDELARRDHDDKEDLDEDMSRLILSLPMEEAKII